MKAPAIHNTPSLADFWDDGPSSAEKKESRNCRNGSDSSGDSNSSSSYAKCNVSDLLNWISNVTIKRRKFRKRSRCSNLLAESVLSRTLRQAKQELAVKQEGKRRKAQEFSYQLNIRVSQDSEKHESQYNNNQVNNYYDNNNIEKDNQVTNISNNSSSDFNAMRDNCRRDEHVQACISSLDNFFSELKSIKV